VTSRREKERGAAARPAHTSPRALVRTALLLLLALRALGATAKPADGQAARTLEFFVDSRTATSLTADALTGSIEPRQVRVFDPYEQTEVTFTALPLEGVLDQAYGASWREHEAILFTCRDGYQPTIPVRRVLAQRAFLAIDRPEIKSGASFTILKYEEGTRKRIDLAPFYVIWENLDDARTRSEGDYGWPYQVERIDLVSFRSRFGEMTPPEDAPANVLAGFEAFVVHCSKCHRVNGHGGAIGPELNYPANPTEYMKDEWLRRWIDDPAKVRFAPRMPPLNPALPQRARVIDEIVAYLQAMTAHKIAPGTP
jgi:mono/diheme cytochrome c family protein